MDNLKKIRFEKLKELLIRDALVQSKTGFVNGQSLENILNNIEEYTVRKLAGYASIDVLLAQRLAPKIYKGEMSIQQALNLSNMFVTLPKDVQESLCEKLFRNGIITSENIEEIIRKEHFACYEIPTQYIIPNRKDLNEEKQRYEESKLKGDRVEEINAKYDYEIKELMYHGTNPLNDGKTIQKIEERRQEELNMTTRKSR